MGLGKKLEKTRGGQIDPFYSISRVNKKSIISLHSFVQMKKTKSLLLRAIQYSLVQS